MVKDSSTTLTITVKPNSSFLSFLMLLMFCGNAVLWKVIEKSGQVKCQKSKEEKEVK